MIHTSGDSNNKDYILRIGHAATGIKIGTEVGQGNLGDYQYNWNLNWQGANGGQSENDKKYWGIDNGGVTGWEQNGEHWHYGLEEQARLIPTYTSANNDQVLTVVSGSPAWVTPSGGGGSDVFYAIIGTTTFSAVWNAVTSGKIVYAVPSWGDPTAVGIDGTEIYRLVQIFNTE